MKIKAFGRTLFPLILVLIAIFLYNLSPSSSSSKPVVLKNAPMPDRLHPVVEERANRLITNAAVNGISIVVTDGFRTMEEQDELFEQGRTNAGDIVTNVKGGGSYHNFGLAVDFAIKLSNGNVIWDLGYDGNGNSIPDWDEVVKLAKELGFEWGGDWKDFQDFPHLQMDFGLTIRDLQRGMRPPGQPVVVDGSEK